MEIRIAYKLSNGIEISELILRYFFTEFG